MKDEAWVESILRVMDARSPMDKNGYVFVKQLIPKETAYLMTQYVVSQGKEGNLKRGQGFPSAEHELTLNVSSENILLRNIHTILRPKIESIVCRDLTPTYPYIRTYFKGSDMFEHTDRPECQYSCTINLGQSDPYPIFMDGNEIHMEPGDGVIYKGCELKHYRLEFTGSWYTQMFLHYIDGTSNAEPWDGKETPQDTLKLVEDTWKELIQ